MIVGNNFYPPESFLSEQEVANIITAKNKSKLVIAVTSLKDKKKVILLKGNLIEKAIPFSAFKISGTGVVPDFNDLEVIDGGQTIRLGKYEAAVDSLL